MIKVSYTKSSIKVSGHALYAQKGKDIVCAGVSAIIFGAVKWFDPKDIKLEQDKKNNSFKLTLKKCSKQNIALLDLIVKQLKPIEKHYSRYITINKGR